MAAHHTPLSLGFSRQEHWSGLPFPSPMHESEKWKRSRSVMSDSSWPHGLQPTRLLCPCDFPGKSTGVGCHYLLQQICWDTIKARLIWVSPGQSFFPKPARDTGSLEFFTPPPPPLTPPQKRPHTKTDRREIITGKAPKCRNLEWQKTAREDENWR